MIDFFQILSIIITILGIALCVFSMFFIFLGKRIQGASGKQQIKYKELEIRSDAVIILLCISVIAAVLPLYLQYRLNIQGYQQTIEKNNELRQTIDKMQSQLQSAQAGPMRIYMTGQVWDGSERERKPLGGVIIRVMRNDPEPAREITRIGPTNDTGFFAKEIPFEGPDDRLTLLAEKSGYSTQEIIIGKDMIIFPPVLSKKP